MDTTVPTGPRGIGVEAEEERAAQEMLHTIYMQDRDMIPLLVAVQLLMPPVEILMLEQPVEIIPVKVAMAMRMTIHPNLADQAL
jgi:hypothetical protein